MAVMSDEMILRVLSAYNPWWDSGAVNPDLLERYHRRAFGEAMEILEDTGMRRSVLLSGVRRVGKTTIQYQMIDSLLRQGISPQRILFVSMDHPVLKLCDFNRLLNCYRDAVYAGQDVYYFFDEIQYVDDWASWLKVLYDLYPCSHTVATGSASLMLNKGARESGVGRWVTVHVSTLSFYEYCTLLNIEQPSLPDDLTLRSLRDMAPYRRSRIMEAMAPLYAHFNRYLLVGGFPETALSGRDSLSQQRIREDIIDKVIKRDLPTLYDIRNTADLERLFVYLCMVSADIVSIEALTKEMQGISRPTVETYIRYLESANLIYLSLPTDLSGKRVLKARPKIYIADAAIRNAVLMDGALLDNPTEMGRVVETAVYGHVMNVCRRRSGRVGYFRGGSKNKEIDIVAELSPSEKNFIEVKYREGAPVPDSDAIIERVSEASLAIIATKHPGDYGLHHAPDGQTLLRIPVFALLYLLH